MASSLRRRLQLWYGALLVGLTLVFAVLLDRQVREVQLSRVDTELVAVADYLDANLRGFPPFELSASVEPPPVELQEAPDRDRRLANLDFPEATGPGRGYDTSGRRKNWFFRIVRDDGQVLKCSNGVPDEQSLSQEKWPLDRPLLRQTGRLRMAFKSGPFDSRIIVGKSIDDELAQIHGFELQLLGITLLVLAVGIAGGWWYSGRIVRPIHEMSRLAESVSEKNLSQRIAVDDADEELVGLATALNVTFDRLEKAFAQQAQLTADASHELRTPLAALRTQAELSLSRPRTPEEYRQALTSCLDAARRMTKLVDGMMTLARADAGQLAQGREQVDFQQLVTRTIDELQPLAFKKDIQIRLSTGPALVQGDAANLARVVTNLVSNAIYYNRPRGRIDVQVSTNGESVLLIVRDTGKGIAEDDRDQLFNRFFRSDRSRTRSSGGHGLGLAITKAIVEAHGGYIDFTSEESTGTTFRVKLPRAEEQHPSPKC